MLYSRHLLFALVCCFSFLYGSGQKLVQPRIHVRTEVHQDRVLLRWVASDAKYPMGAVIAQAIFGESFEVSLGDSPISKAIALDEERQQRYLFALYAADLCFPVAKEVGWGFEDVKLQSGERYLYRVSSLVPKKELAIEGGAAFVVVGDTVRLPQPMELSAQFGPSGAYLSWDYNRLSSLYPAYWLERSEDGVSFSRISELPITRMSDSEKNPYAPITYLDSTPYRKTYYYRVAGVTPFGSQGAYSVPISGMSYPPLMAAPQIQNYGMAKHGGARLSWNFNTVDEELIEGFRILRSQDDMRYHPYDSVSAKQRVYVIENLERYPYYKVEAKAKQGASMSSFPILIQAIDSIPPASPKGLKAEVDSLGAVYLSWQAGGEEDLYGYRLYRAETKGEELIPITSEAIVGTSYIDSIRLDNLNAEVYYALTALDERYNQSEMSTSVAVRKPACIPPATPLIVEAKATEEGNSIRWEPGRDKFLEGFLLTRTEQNDSLNRKSWLLEDGTAVSYVDKEVEAGKTYIYQIAAYTTHKVYLPPSPAVKLLSRRAKPRDISFTTELVPDGIALKWRAPKQVVISVTLYKVDASGKMGVCRENLPQEGELIDTEVSQGKKNEYMLVVKMRGNKPISVRKEVQL